MNIEARLSRVERTLAEDEGPPRVPVEIDGVTILVPPDVPAKIEKIYGGGGSE